MNKSQHGVCNIDSTIIIQNDHTARAFNQLVSTLKGEKVWKGSAKIPSGCTLEFWNHGYQGASITVTLTDNCLNLDIREGNSREISVKMMRKQCQVQYNGNAQLMGVPEYRVLIRLVEDSILTVRTKPDAHAFLVDDFGVLLPPFGDDDGEFTDAQIKTMVSGSVA